MKIEIHLRTRTADGRFVGKRNAFVESSRVYAEAGDGVMLANLAPHAEVYFRILATEFCKAFQKSR